MIPQPANRRPPSSTAVTKDNLGPDESREPRIVGEGERPKGYRPGSWQSDLVPNLHLS
jgi:hypothetical protein